MIRSAPISFTARRSSCPSSRPPRRRPGLATALLGGGLVVAWAGCKNGSDPGGAADASSTGATTEGSGSSSSSGEEPASSSDGSGSTSDAEDTTTAGMTLNGEQCSSREQCQSGFCFQVGALGGLCGECESDADCEFGCTVPNPRAIPPEGSTCADGSLGAGCESEGACAEELFCALILDIPNLGSASTCSECVTDTDCTDGELCNPDIDIVSITGVRTCVTPGSVPDGETCDAAASGDAACTNFCAPANAFGAVGVGVCSPCTVDGNGDAVGCQPGETCMLPGVDLTMGLTAAACVAT